MDITAIEPVTVLFITLSKVMCFFSALMLLCISFQDLLNLQLEHLQVNIK